MDSILHALIAVGCMVASYYAGRHFSNKQDTHSIVDKLLSTLEKEGFIHTTIDKDGEKEIIPVSEIITKALQDKKST